MSYEDDDSISNDEILWRRIPPDQIVDDEMRGKRPTSKAFQNSSEDYHKSVMAPLGFTHGPGMSVNIASETTTEDVLKENPDFYLVEFSTGLIRELKQGVIRAPLPNDPSHSEVMGKKTKGVRNQLSQKCKWVISP